MPKILVVEDSERSRTMLRRRLARIGYEVLMASDGVQALDAARRERPDLILMDLSLPVPHGWDTTRMLKADPLTVRVPVIALAAHAMADDRQRAMDAGCDEFETKPVDLPALVRKITRLLEVTRRPASTPRTVGNPS
jgi:two-component system, cell cycle response regulator DivK